MNIFVDLANELIAEAIYQLLLQCGYANVVTSRKPPTNGFTPEVLLVDITTLTHHLLSRYPGAKVLLIDTGITKEKLYATLLLHRIHGILPLHADLSLLKKVLTAVGAGQFWIDNGSTSALFHGAGAIPRPAETSRVTDREQEIIESVCQGLSNQEIARRLTLSPNTVKAHLNRIFRKLNIKRRSQLLSLTMQSQQATRA
jgi:DNA-binding NarL/FixJ family response regulator